MRALACTAIMIGVCAPFVSCGEDAGSARGLGSATSELVQPVTPIGSLEVSIEPTRARVGDALRMTARADLDAGASLRLNEQETALPPRWTIEVDGEEAGRTENRWLRQWVIEPFGTGEAEIGPFVFEAEGSGADGPTRVQLPAITVEIVSAFAEGEAVGYDPLRPARERPAEVPWLWIAGGVVALGVLIAAGVWIARREIERRRRPIETTPDRIAREALAELRGSSVMRSGNHALVLERLVDVLREYLDHRAEIPAGEMTTREVRTAVTSVFGKDEADEIASLLESVDLVKFARGQAAEQQVADAFERVDRFIGAHGDGGVVIFVDRSGEIVGREVQAA